MKLSYYLFPFLLVFLWNKAISQAKVVQKSSKNLVLKHAVTEKVNRLIEKYDKANTPGLVVSVIKDGTVIYNKGIGIANLEYNVPVTTKSVFVVGSLSKQFTAFAILLLEQDNKLTLDDDIRKYLPEMANYGHTITLRHLANHTSGIRDNTDLANLVGINELDMLSNEQVIKLIINQKGLNFIPGEKFEYCNSNYILLAEIIKRVSGKTFAAFIKERIFNPLKMKNSLFLDDPEIVIKNKAYSYYKPDSIYYKSILNHSFVGSTGLNITSEDLNLWAMNFEKQIIGNKNIFDKMKKRGKLNNGEIIPYAFGQELKEYKGLNIIFHGGGDAGYRAYFLRVPAYNFSVTVMGNDQAFNPLDIAYDIVDYYLKDKETITPQIKPVAIDTSILQTLIGDYEVFPGLIISIDRDKDSLFLYVKGDDQKVKLPALNNYEFIYPNRPHSKIVFNKMNEVKVNNLKWHFSDFAYEGKRIILKEFDKTKVNLTELVGKYFNSELNTEYDFVIKDNKLVATHNRNEDILLTPLQPDVYISNNGFFGKMEVIRNEQQKIIGCYISAQRARNIKFEKITAK